MTESDSEHRLTVKEYLAQEQRSTARHEYIAGLLRATTGSSDAHNIICVNLTSFFHVQLRGTGCRAYANDMKVRIETADCFYYPDVMVTCEPIDRNSRYKERPVIIMEILSPSTKHIDRREKLLNYCELDSLREYILVHQNRKRLERHSRDENGVWTTAVLSASDTLSLSCLPCGLVNVPVSEIYSDLDLPSTVEESEEEYEFEL